MVVKIWKICLEFGGGGGRKTVLLTAFKKVKMNHQPDEDKSFYPGCNR